MNKLYIDTDKIGSEELEFYPIEYLTKLAEILNCKVEDLELITSIRNKEEEHDEIWILEDLSEIMVNPIVEEFEVIADEFSGVSIGHIQLIKINEIPLVMEQNASPIGFWIKSENLINLKN